MKVLPLFKSHYSIGRSILTLESLNDFKKLEKKWRTRDKVPDSIINLVKENGISQAVLVEDSFSGFMEAYTNFFEIDVSFIFGVRITCTDNLTKKDPQSLENQHKIVILARNTEGYRMLSKLYTQAATEGLYYEPRIDFQTLKENWNENNLRLAIPFYDSFIYENIMHRKKCVPDFSFTQPVFFVENNELPFDDLLNSAVERYVNHTFETVATKSIYYNKRADFKAYLTFRCINNRTSLSKPQLEHMSSCEFSLESWKETNV